MADGIFRRARARLSRERRRLLRPWQGGSWPDGIQPAAAVPFACDLSAVTAPARGIAVVCHLFYAELASELRQVIGTIPFAADLYFSTDTAAKAERIEQAFGDWTAGQVEVRLSPNRGRDIAPKFVTFADIYASHELVLFLHGKKSLTFDGGGAWRDALYRTLAGSPDIVRSIVALFAAQPDLGIVAPQHHGPIRQFIPWDENFGAAHGLARRFGVMLSRGAPIDFAAGSMFWARTAALRPLLDLKLTHDDFPPERGQVRRTTQHAIERLVLVAAEHAGFGWTRVTAPEHFPADDPVVVIDGPAALQRFLTASRRRLLAR